MRCVLQTNCLETRMNCDICSSVEWMRFSLCFLWLCSTVGASPEHLSRLFSTMRCQAVVLFWTLRVRHISFVFWMELYLFTDFFFSQHFFLSFLLFNQYNLLLLKIAIHHIHKWVDKIKCKYTVNSASSSQHSNRMNKERKWSTNLSRSISIGEWLWLCGKLVCNFRHHLLVCFYDGAFLLCSSSFVAALFKNICRKVFYTGRNSMESFCATRYQRCSCWFRNNRRWIVCFSYFFSYWILCVCVTDAID